MYTTNGCAKLAGTGTCRHIRWSRAYQTPLMGDTSGGEYAGRERTVMISVSKNCVQILASWGPALSCCNRRWCSWMHGTNNEPQNLVTVSLHSKCHQSNAPVFSSITYICPYHNHTTLGDHTRCWLFFFFWVPRHFSEWPFIGKQPNPLSCSWSSLLERLTIKYFWQGHAKT